MNTLFQELLAQGVSIDPEKRAAIQTARTKIVRDLLLQLEAACAARGGPSTCPCRRCANLRMRTQESAV